MEGGEVLEVVIEEKWKLIKNKLQRLYESPDSRQIIQLVEQEGTKPLTLEKLQYRLGISEDQIKTMVDETEDLFWLSHKQSKWLVTKTDRKSVCRERV